MRNPANRVSRVLTAAMLASTFVLVTPAVRSQGSDQAPLKRVADIPLPGAAVRFDYQSLDRSQGRLYIAHMNANQLVVFDTKKRVVVATLTVAGLREAVIEGALLRLRPR